MSPNRRLRTRRRESGVVLIVALVMLVAMMLLGISGLSGTGLQLRMGSGMYEREIAFKAAESAMRDAAKAISPPNAPVFNGANGLYPTPTPAIPGFVERWLDPVTNWQNGRTLTQGPKLLTPQYVVEFMGAFENTPGCSQSMTYTATCMSNRYRITSRSASPGVGTDASVILQSTYRPL